MQRWTWYLAAAGVAAAIAAALASPGSAGPAAGQVWPAFVIVAGLLLIGLVAAEDGLFAAAGQRLAAACRSNGLLFAGVAGLVMVVTALLNLDTSVAFLTPVVVHTSGRRRDDGVVLISACLLLSNAGSLLLPGSNLTNLIVLGGMHMSGGSFAARMALPWMVAGVLTAAVVAVAGRRSLRRRPVITDEEPERPVLGVGLAAIAAAVVLILTIPNPAPEVAAVGVVVAATRLLQGRTSLGRAREVLGLPVLTGLFGLAVGLGTLGRDWTAPARALSHLDAWTTAGVGGLSTVLINNLPAASLLSARPPAHPLSLLIGLNLGPNLFVSGSLAWVLWYNAARLSGGRPDVGRTVRIGLVAAPLSMAAAVGALMLTSHIT
ncbi:MAG TPA: SLC13 family permease [Acidimicrobiales bacterium]|nr:SLC13 family permease [Acidimicrobiales bacterium]